ncbi:MAG: hypothetical protein GXP49_04180 [Deltaproteobacteria bacterium]|nr:hypothetical protein [Deltaproteobacteria bacterium]
MKKGKLFWLVSLSLAFGPLIGVAFLTQGCGGSDSGGKKGVAIADYCPQLLDVFCEKRIECFSKEALSYEGYTTKKECVDALQDLCKGQPEGWNTSINKKRLQYHSEKAQSCFDAVKKASCEQISWDNTSLIQECQDVFVGLVGQGGDCTAWTAECALGAWCMPKGYPTLTCKSGSCKMFKLENESCDKQKGEICSAGLACVNGKCAKLSQENGSCSGGATCAAGLKCLDDKKCHKIISIGETCDDTNGDPCDVHSYCDGTKCVGLPKVGEACGGNRPTADCWGSYCVFPAGQTEGTCTAYPKVGEACSNDTTTTCINGYCDLVEGKCKAFKDNGAACEDNKECKSLVCDTADTKVCVDQVCP